ncbi:MAG: ABC transporter ATP-binding protein [Gammaproteobacteria bacterium]|nr:MAG: ABC transporter ATP-binding protein [Gammaproteobacteria bacterium]RLA61700.1 MAG: ABC transporter ATP-binding protein [Gammaproteobacteria bacterium]
MSGETILEARDIDVFYGSSQIIFSASFSIEKGQCMALLGRNGAGKSTTFKALAGLAPPHSGEIILNGQPVQGMKPYKISRMGVGYVPEDRQVFPEHSVLDNLIVGAKSGEAGASYWTLDRIFEIFPLLEKLRNRAAGKLSGGEQQLLSIARTLMGNPEVLLLDEPSEGLAPIIVARIGDLIRQLQSMGSTIFLAEQNLYFCLSVATHATVIDNGHIVYCDTMAALRDNEDIKKRYLAV